MTHQSQPDQNPHQGQPIRVAGEPVGIAQAVMLMMHGRGASAVDILSLSDQFDQSGFAYLAPQAAENTWYPARFLAPVEDNEPWLSSALAFVGDVFAEIIKAGIPSERVMLMGFYTARLPRVTGRYTSLSGM